MESVACCLGQEERPAPSFSPKMVNFLRWAGLVSACFGMMATSSVSSFNSYANDIKMTFKLTQSQVESLAGFANMGSCAGLPVGFALDLLGVHCTILGGFMLTVTANLLMWNATLFTHFFHSHAWLLVIFMFMYGFGTTCMYMSIILTNMKNFSVKHRGTVVAVIGAFFWAGPALFSAVYASLFHRHTDVGGYFVMLVVVFACANTLLFVTLHSLEVTSGGQPATEVTSLVSPKVCEGLLFEPRYGDVSGLRLLRIVDYHLLIWTFVLISSTQVMFINNIPTYLSSYHILGLDMTANVLGPVVGCAAKLTVAISSDALLDRLPRAIFLVIICSLQCAAILLCIICPGNSGVFLTAVVVIYSANGSLFILIPTIISEYFGMTGFGRNYGIAMAAYGIAGWIMLAVFGYVYDRKVDEDVNACFGDECFFHSYMIATLCCILATCLTTLLTVRYYKDADGDTQGVDDETGKPEETKGEISAPSPGEDIIP